MVRILRTFDGSTRWTFDQNQDGSPDLAGDFDGDGTVDVAASARLHALGGSLGGMMASLIGALEPQIETIIPISGGGGLADLGIRSQQGGVREAFIFWTLGPMFYVNADLSTGQARVDLQTADFVLERDYLAPIVDHAEARERTLARYAVVKKAA